MQAKFLKTISYLMTLSLSIGMSGCGGAPGDDTPPSFTPIGTDPGEPTTPTEHYTGPSAAILQSKFEAQLPPVITSVIDKTGDITASETWTKDNVYHLTNLVKIKSGATLTIEAGTTVVGSPTAYLVVVKGSRIVANGTAAEPIIFDSKAHYDGGLAGAGQWGGVTLLGSANVNENNLFYEVNEADPDFAFGTFNSTANDAEDSGILRHVKILNSGFAVAENKEVNGLSLCAIGSGTTIEDITVVNSGDDGVELWGGTVNLSNIKIVNALDDSFDVDNGYTGTVTNLKVVQAEAAAAAVEMTNSGDAAIVRTNPTINGFELVTAVTQKKEGGLYFKDSDTTGTFNDGRIVHYGLDGALHSKESMTAGAQALLSFNNINIQTVNSKLYGGLSAAVLQAEYEAQLPPAIATVVEKSGDITVSETWTKDTVWHLTNLVKIKSGATLTIEAGTTVVGSPTAYLVVVKGSRIVANGTLAEPIVFDSKSHYDGGDAGAGQWGGVTLLGSANVNENNLFYEVNEADPDFAFGTFGNIIFNGESSGILRHVQILNSGFAVAENKEVNGLSLCAIGSGTTIEDITVINSGDDGVELWGGVVDLTNIKIINALDDTFDVDNGYTGTVTNLSIIQAEPAAGGIEMTNSGDASAVRSNPTFNGYEIITSSVQKKEGGIYFKDLDTTATFNNGTIIHYGLDGSLHSNELMSSGAESLLTFSQSTILQ